MCLVIFGAPYWGQESKQKFEKQDQKTYDGEKNLAQLLIYFHVNALKNSSTLQCVKLLFNFS